MNPFASKLRSLRIGRGLRQSELADRIGYEQSYVSALELGLKGPPTQEFLDSLVQVLQLSPAELSEVDQTVLASQRKISIPSDADEEVFWLCHSLSQQLGQLHPVQISLIQTALRLPEEMQVTGSVGEMRLKRRSSSKRFEEVQM